MRSHHSFARIARGLPVLGALSAMAIGFGSAPKRANAATTYFFDVNGTTSGYGTFVGPYNWDDTTNGGLWDTATAGTGPISGWSQGQFPNFAPTGAPTYTVTVSNDEQIAGMFASTAQTLTINASGSGALEIVGGIQGLIGTSTASVTINAPITGSGGGINPNNGGNWFLNASNTYAGGTSLTSSSTLIHFSNGSSFGTSVITNNLASTSNFVPLLGSGGALITLPNDFANGVTNSGVNFATDPNTPITSTGKWSLGANNLRLRNNGNNTSTLTLSGVISGSANLVLSGANGGAIIFSGSNTYTGSTTVGVSGATSTTLKLGAANTIATSTSLVLAGGKLDPGGFTHTMTGTTLGMTAASIIDFSAGASEMDFAKSSGLTWTGILNLTSWTPGTDALRFGTDNTGLTSTQLANIEFNGSGLGTAGLDPSGFLITVPEPMIGLFALGTPILLSRRRRR